MTVDFFVSSGLEASGVVRLRFFVVKLVRSVLFLVSRALACFLSSRAILNFCVFHRSISLSKKEGG